MGDEEIMQAAGAGQAHLIGGVEDARGLAQQASRMVKRERRHERLRRQSGPAAEQMVQLGGRDPAGIGNLPDVRLGAPVFGDEGDGAAHHRIIVSRAAGGGVGQSAVRRAGGV